MSIIFTILGVVLGAVTAAVLLTYSIFWYETANQNPELMQNRFKIKTLWLTVHLFAMEILCLFITTLLHPFGWLQSNENPPQDIPATPVIFLHGLFHNRACWLWMKWRLKRRGFHSLHTLNLPPWRDLETLTERVAKKVDELRHTTGIDKVHLVGHSMGGLIARNYIQIRGGSTKVERCLLLGTPNAGSKLAAFTITPLGKLLLPGSEFLVRLANTPIPPKTSLTAIYSRHDNLVLPYENASLEGAQNIELKGLGHTSILYNSRTLDAIAKGLKGNPQ